jgi:CHAD domain-containing protein
VNSLVQYLKKQQHACVKQMQLFVSENDAEAVHQLRVALKKIRASYRFLKTLKLSPTVKKNYKNLLHPFFTEAGELRRLQLLRQMLLDHQWQQMILFSESLNSEAVRTYLLKQNFDANRKVINKLTHALQQKAKPVKEENGFLYAAKLHLTIITVITKHSVDDLHELRKQIKQLLYSYQWMPPHLQLRLLTVNQYRQLDVLQEAIGQWHDLQDFKDWLGAEGFFMSSSKAVKKEFAAAWSFVNSQLKGAEKKLPFLLLQVSRQKTAALKYNVR